MNITLRQVEVFLAVAEELHFGRAASRLHVSQPVVSQEINRLERALAITLFDRSTRLVRPTKAGDELIADARIIESGVREMTEHAHRLRPERATKVCVAATPSVMDQLLPQVLRAAEVQLPDVVIDDVPVDTGGINEALQSGCDVGLGRFVEPPTGFHSELLREEPIVAAVSADHAAANLSGIQLHHLTDLPLLLWPRQQSPSYYDYLLQVCQQRGLDPMLLITSPRVVGARSYLVAEARAFCLVPLSTALVLPTGIVARPITPPATLPLSAIWPEYDPRPVIADFVALLRSNSQGGIENGKPQ